MSPSFELTDIDQQIIDIVVSQFVSEKKPTPRRQLLVKFEDSDILEKLINRSFLQDVGRHAVLPTLLAFHFSKDAEASQLARESVNTVLYVLRTLFLETEENKQITPAEIEKRAQELGRTISPKTIWLGLYLVQNYFGVIGTTAGNDQTPIVWLNVSEGILKYKNAEKAWETRIEQELQWTIKHDSYNPATPFQELDHDEHATREQKGLLIFISHSSKDSGIALSLIELLRAALGLADEQIRCTSVDGFRLPSGANVDDVLKAEVLEAQAFIGLITPKSVSSAYVLFELGARWGAGRHMIPVLAGVGPEALQGPLKGINSISANSIAQLHQLLSDLADALGLDLLRAASYTRYAEKLIAELQGSYRISSATPSVSRPTPPRDVGQEGGERRLRALTRGDVITASKTLNWNKQLPKWTVMIEGISFPVRPLAFKAAGLFPNDSATTHQAVAVLKRLGFEVFYENELA